jgi:hypothetical protein
MNFQAHRPQGYIGAGDRHLPRIVRNLKRFLINGQNKLVHDTLRLTNKEWGDLASVLVEFMEDIHNDIGIWRSLEQYHLEFFNTPLPLFLQPGEEIAPQKLNKYRLCHLLWVLYHELKPGLVLAPTHQDLYRLAVQIDNFLTRKFVNVPRGSGVKQFLSQPHQFGWDVKRKLVWMGQNAYLFRHSFWNYVAANDEQADINTIDDFICQETTAWSGLGVIDILAATLDINAKQRTTLRSWYERHLAYYHVVSIKKTHLKVKNLINDQLYGIRMDNPGSTFRKGQIVFGSLVPWDGDWYWSGGQRAFEAVPADALQEIKQTFHQKMPAIAYRYCPQKAEAAREAVDRHYQSFVKYYGGDLAVYPDGPAMAADMEKQYRVHNEAMSDEVVSKAQAKHGLSSTSPRVSLPPELAENENGIAVYFNAGEGQEIMTGFNDVVSGLKKRGQDLTEDEADAIHSLMLSDAISPDFVRRLIGKYGDESIASTFLLKNTDNKTYLDYLLRRYKGHFYRNRYPQVTLV